MKPWRTANAQIGSALYGSSHDGPESLRGANRVARPLGLVASTPKTDGRRRSIMRVHCVIASACRPYSTDLSEALSLATDLRFFVLLRR